MRIADIGPTERWIIISPAQDPALRCACLHSRVGPRRGVFMLARVLLAHFCKRVTEGGATVSAYMVVLVQDLQCRLTSRRLNPAGK